MNQRGDAAEARVYACPSAPAHHEDALVFGVVAGTEDATEIAYLQEPVPMTAELRAMTNGLHAGEVFRTTSRCLESGCREYANGRCTLGDRIVDTLPALSGALPPCSIRTSCRWFAEQGPRACQRCPQIVTFVPSRPSDANSKTRRHLRVV